MLRMTDVAELLGVTAQRVQQIYKLGRLPEPAKRDQVGPLWRKSDIEKWARAEWWGQSRAPWRSRRPQEGS
jgi:predicted DNA-binding transcriptional regulator AlpA